jgi:endoglucanase
LSLLAIAISAGAAAALARAPSAHEAGSPQCRDPYTSNRDPSNPLMLTNAPGSNPLSGARFFVDGPRHGSAAGMVAQLLGVDPQSYKDNYSWAKFKASIDHGRLHHKLSGRSHALLRWKVNMLEKIAERPEAQRFSMYNQGGGPGAIYSQVQKIFCHNLTADPGSIPIISTFFLYQQGYCETAQQILDSRPTFERQINEMADGTGNRPAVYLLELDAVGASRCEADKGALSAWEDDLRYEIDTMSSLPHTVVYVEAGYSDGNGPAYTAGVLNAVGIQKIRGFFTNDTHLNWTINEVQWAEKISSMTHGAHFIVNTAQNGHGPLVNRHRVTQGNEDLCNPPGRGLGPLPTIDPGFPHVDGFLWTHVPGNSSGCGGGPPAGVFWPARAMELAANADDRLGPRYPSSPY